MRSFGYELAIALGLAALTMWTLVWYAGTRSQLPPPIAQPPSFPNPRHARLRANGGRHTAQEWQALCAQYKGRCAACGKKRPLTKDHVVPVYFGGSDDISNLQPLCKYCNSKKGTRTIDYRKHPKNQP